MGNEKISCIIFTAFGEIEKTVKELNIKTDDIVIAADNGLTKALQYEITPHLVVGDMDSMQFGKIPENIKVLKSSPVKDDTDTLLAVREGFQRGYRDFLIVGGLGGRLDHTIANLQVLNHIRLEGGSGVIIDDNTRCTVIREETITVSPHYRYCSLFSLGERAEGITLQGFKYPLTNATVTNFFPVGVSNEILKNDGKITVKNGSLLIIQNN